MSTHTAFMQKLFSPINNALRVRNFVQEFKRGMKTETSDHVIQGTFVDGAVLVTIDGKQAPTVSVLRNGRITEAILFEGHLLGEGIDLRLDNQTLTDLYKYKTLSLLHKGTQEIMLAIHL